MEKKKRTQMESKRNESIGGNKMNVLEIKKLQQVFEKGTPNEHHALKDIHLTLKKEDFVVIIGGNGAGKSTLLNSIAGSLPITKGQIKVKGKDITYDSVEKRAAYIARVFQDPRAGTSPLLTVKENLSLAQKRGSWRNFWKPGVKAKELSFFKERLKELDLGLEKRLNTEIGLLSGGQRQAITLLMATLKRPDLLLLDEHTAALDPKTSLNVMTLTQKLVEKNHLTTLMITHDMQDAITYGNRLIMLNHGQIVVDISGEEKKSLTIPRLLELFKQSSGKAFTNDQVLLG